MKTNMSTFRMTVYFGLVCGILWIPLWTLLSGLFRYASIIHLILWGSIGAYAFLLTRWAGKSVASVIFPVFLLFIAQWAVLIQNGYLAILVAGLAWVRSGICFPGPILKCVFLEAVLGAGAGLLVAAFQPRTPVSWALAIWLFFLIQSLYFLMTEKSRGEERGQFPIDPFETARRQAEKILSDGI